MGGCSLGALQVFHYLLFKIPHPEGAPRNLVDSFGRDQEPVSQNPDQLSVVDLRYKNMSVSAQKLFKIFREGIEISKVDMGHINPFFTQLLNSGPDGAVGGTPPDEYSFPPGAPQFHILKGDMVRHGFYLVSAQMNHLLVVFRIVGDIAGLILFFQSSHPVLQTGGAGNGPG